MSKKFLLVLFLIIFVSIGIVSAQDNSTDEVVSDFDDSAESLNAVDESVLSQSDDDELISDDYDDYYDSEDYEDDYDDYDDDYDDEDTDYYYEKAVIKPVKLKTTYNSGKTFNVKVVSYYDRSFPLDDVKLKLRVYSKHSYKDYYAYTNYYGIAKFKVSNLALGYHKAVLSAKDSYTSAKKVTSSIKINKAKTKVYAPKVKTKYKKSKKFKIRIKDKATRKPVKRVKISVKVGYKHYTLKTNYKGMASFNTKYLSPGTYKVTIKSKNSKYKIFKTSRIIVKNVAKKKTTRTHYSSSSSSSSSGGGYYVGSINSDKFHYPSCSAAKRIKSYNRITFSSRSSAINSGYSSCGICHP